MATARTELPPRGCPIRGVSGQRTSGASGAKARILNRTAYGTTERRALPGQNQKQRPHMARLKSCPSRSKSKARAAYGTTESRALPSQNQKQAGECLSTLLEPGAQGMAPAPHNHRNPQSTAAGLRWWVVLLPAPGLRRRLRGRRAPCAGGGRPGRCGRIREWFSNPCG
jgi:hypothetical protein